jgi:ParB family chromosome partitioning protein
LTLPVHDDLDDDVVSSIAESFPLAGGGLINPITVRRVREQEDGEEVVKTVLVAGAHRLEAARRAGMKYINCTYLEGDETEARIVQIEENLFRKDLTVLQHAELLAEWAELALTKGYISGQRGRKSKLGRPQGGFSKLARKLPTVGRSFEARRKIIARATKIAGISAVAKDAAKDVGLDDNQKALLKIAKASGQKPRSGRRRSSATNCDRQLGCGGQAQIRREMIRSGNSMALLKARRFNQARTRKRKRGLMMERPCRRTQPLMS